MMSNRQIRAAMARFGYSRTDSKLFEMVKYAIQMHELYHSPLSAGKGLRLTKRQKEALKYIQDYVDAHDDTPTLYQLRDALGVTTRQSVVNLLKKLERWGWVRMTYYTGKIVLLRRLE